MKLKLDIDKATPVLLPISGLDIPMIVIPYERGRRPEDLLCYFYDIPSGGHWINSAISPGREELLPLNKIEPALKRKAITEMFSADNLFK